METATMSIEQRVALILAQFGLDFKIIKLPLVGVKGEGADKDLIPSEYFGLMNDKSGEIINTCKAGYTVSQNEDVVKLVLAGIAKFGDQLTVQKAGSLNGGRKVFIQLAIEGMSKVGTDYIKRYVTIIDSNDGSCSLSVGIGDVTLSCTNQFAKFYGKGECKFRHSATLEQKMLQLPQLIETALAKSMEQIEIYRRLTEIEATPYMVHEIVKHVLGHDKHITSMEEQAKKSTRSINTMEKMYEHISKEMAQKGMTLWGLHSGITSFTTHEKKAPNRDNGKEESLMIGGAYRMNQASLSFVMAKAGIAEVE